MKTLFFAFLLASIGLADTVNCKLRPSNQTLFKLAQEVEAVCDWTIEEIATAYIFKQCAEAPKSAGVKLRAGNPPKLRFTVLSNTYDTSDPYYYCKNKKGHEAYLKHLTAKLRNEVNETQKKEREEREASQRVADWKSNKPVSRPARTVSSQPSKPKKYRCVLPGYLPEPIIATENQVFGIENTYGDICTPIEE